MPAAYYNIKRMDLEKRTDGKWDVTATYQNSSTSATGTWSGVLGDQYVAQSESSNQGSIIVNASGIGSTYRFQSGLHQINYVF